MTDDLRKHLDWESLATAGYVPVLLIRHAQTAWNRERRFNGQADTPLDALGLQQARALGHALASVPLAAVFASPLRRAMATAESLTEGRTLGVPQPAPALLELHHGVLDGMLAADALAQYGDLLARWRQSPGDVRLPGGETLAECQLRALAGLGALLSGFEPGPPVAIVSHQMVLSALLCAAQDLPLTRYSDFSQRNTACNLLSWRDGALRAVRLNLTDHLD